MNSYHEDVIFLGSGPENIDLGTIRIRQFSDQMLHGPNSPSLWQNLQGADSPEKLANLTGYRIRDHSTFGSGFFLLAEGLFLGESKPIP